MAFEKRTWKNRISEHPARRRLIDPSTNDDQIVDVERYEGTISEAGDTFSAENMNDLEDRIEQGFDDIPEIIIDTELSTISANAVQNNVIAAAINGKANSSHTHGYIQNTGSISQNAAIANGDKIIIADASDSNKLVRTSIQFDGSTTTKYLSQKGTWETPSVFKAIVGANSPYKSTYQVATVVSWTADVDCWVTYIEPAQYNYIKINGYNIWGNPDGDYYYPYLFPLKAGQTIRLEQGQWQVERDGRIGFTAYKAG